MRDSLLTSSRCPAALADRDRRADTNGTHIIDGASGTAAMKGRPSTALVRTKIAAGAAPPQQFFGLDVTTIRRRIANGAVLAKSLVCLSLFVLVSAIAVIYKYLILAVTYVMARLYPAEFDRDAVIDALSEIEKDSGLTIYSGGDA
jgi:hypothetical protein